MAWRRGGSYDDLSRHGHGIGGRQGGPTAQGGHAGHLVGGNLRRERSLLGFAREARGHEQSAGQQEADARHSQKPPMIRDPQERRSNGAVGRDSIRTAALPRSRDIDVDLLQGLDSLTLRPPDQVFV